jgi:hypothetical protein
MKKVRWLAPRETRRRVLTAADFKQLGVAHPSDETFSKENDFTVLMEDEACETLVSKLPDEFVVLGAPADEVTTEEGSLELASDYLIASSSQVQPEGSSSESLGDETTEGESSPSTRSRKR